MNKKTKWRVTAVILLLILGMIFYPRIKQFILASQDSKTAVLPPVNTTNRQVLNINAEVLQFRSLTDKIISIGTLIPDEEVDLSFESSGKIVAIYFQEGTAVQEGDLLAKINDKPLQAQLKKLEAQTPLAKDRVYRQRTLLEKDAVSQEAFEQVATEYETLMADIELVKANIAQTELRAPFDGAIGLRSVSEGAYVTPATMIANLTKITPLKIEFTINETHSRDVKEGTDLIFKLEGSDGRMREYEAKVYAVESKLDMDTRSLTVRAYYPNPRGMILPGRFASVEITKQEIPQALTIPSQAIIPEMGKNTVFYIKTASLSRRKLL